MPSERPGDAVEHLVCTTCDASPTIARIDGWLRAVCHCTYVDSDLEPPALTELAPLPDRWEFRATGGASA